MSHAYARTGSLPDSHSHSHSHSGVATRDEADADALHGELSQDGHYTVALADESQSMAQIPLQQRGASAGAEGEDSSSSSPASPHAALVAAPGSPSDRITVHSLYRGSPLAHEALLRKLTLRLLPFLLILYTFSFLDRSNLSNVQHAMVADLGLSIEQYGTAASIFFVPYVALEIPSNMILERVDARRWLARIIFSWGLIATLMLAIRSFGALVLARFLLGVAEAGFFPGIIFYLTLWFTPKERAQRLAFIFVAQPFSGIMGGLLAYPILNYMDGVGGMAGWRWVFLLEGTPTVFLGVATWFYLPAKPHEASWLSNEEKNFLTMRMKGVTAHGEVPEEDELQRRQQHSSRTSSRSNSHSSEHDVTELTPAIAHGHEGASSSSADGPAASAVGVGLVSPPPRSWRTRLELSYVASMLELKSLYKSTFSNRIIYLCILCNFLILMPVQAITFYLPAIVGELGVGALAANGVSAIPYTFAMVSLFAVSIHSDRKQERVWHIIGCNVLGFVALAATAATLSVDRVSEGGKSDLNLVFWQLFFLSLTAAGVWGCKPALMALFTANLRGNIAVAIAAVTTVGNLSGIIAPIVMSALRAGSGNYASGCLFLMACLVLASITVHQLHREIEKQARITRGLVLDRAEQMELSVLQNRAEEPSSIRGQAEDDGAHALDVDDSSLVHLSPSEESGGYFPSRSQVHGALTSPAVESPALDVDASYSQQRHVTSKLQ